MDGFIIGSGTDLADFFINELGCTASIYLRRSIIPTPPIPATCNKKKNSKKYINIIYER